MTTARAAQRSLRIIRAFAAMAIVCAVAAACQAEHSQIQASSGSVVSRGSDPLGVGRRMSVSDARAAVGFAVLMPRPSGAVARVHVTQAWVNSISRQVALVLDHGKITVMMWPVQAFHKNAVKYFREFIAQNHASIYIGRVNGSPVLVIRPHTDINRTNPAWVEFYRNGIDINIYSASYGSRALLQIAGSMR